MDCKTNKDREQDIGIPYITDRRQATRIQNVQRDPAMVQAVSQWT